RQGWDAFFSDPFLSTESVKDRGVLGKIGGESLRSLYWKIYLEYFPSLETDAWTLILQKERQSYDDLKASFLTNPAKERSRDDLEVNNPLSLEEDSPWTQYFKDTELQKVIRQDVERTMPDQSFFREPSIQELMTNILFIWSKVNPDVSYRQGMHELLAPVVFVVNEDKFDPSTDPTLPSEQAIVFDSRFVEHDAFVLFSRIMRSAKPWFVVGQESSGKSKVVKAAVFDDPRGRIEQKTIPIIAHCRKIQNELIRVLDPELHLHLQGLGIEPQLYALRWLRLLFGREFEFADLFQLWDGLFADDPNLGLVDWICAALLIFLRKDLINSDYSMALHRLMKFPSKDQLNTTPAEFIASAKGLRERYAQKALQAAAPLSPVEQSAPTTVRRGNAVPWISHASNQRTNPLSPPAVTNSPAADIDARATSPGSTDDTSTNNAKVALLESRIATLWREAQKAKER
ncbi:rab-GTPase-TBC domain-containing protein, partial [Zopfochytrium polystomum]